MPTPDHTEPPADTTGPLRVLVVCTANICRSPVAAALLQKYLVQAGHHVRVSSAGTDGSDRRPHEFTIDAARLAGIDIGDHVARRLTAEMLRTEGADLVIGLTREHLRYAVGLSDEAWRRTFTLKELARRANELAATDGYSTDGPWADWVRTLSSVRSPADYIRPDPVDDVPDPYGRPATDHVLMVHLVDQVTRHIAQLAPSPPTS